MGRVQEQLQTHSKLRFNNPALAKELKAKAEQHLELLMGLAESQQKQHIQGNSSSGTSDLQHVLHELTVQLDLEQQAMLTASIDTPAPDGPSTSSEATIDTNSTYQSFNSQPTDGSSPDTSSSADKLREQVQQAEAAAAASQKQLSEATARVSSLQQQLAELEAALQSANEELSEHRELQMAYDKQCQDLYRLRMQLQLVRTQGNDAVSLAAQANKQHKQVRCGMRCANVLQLKAGFVLFAYACDGCCGPPSTAQHSTAQGRVCCSQAIQVVRLFSNLPGWGRCSGAGATGTAAVLHPLCA
jgi:chromosome segregation ATPase